MRSGIDNARNAAMTAENKPVCTTFVNACSGTEYDMGTHKNQEPIGIFLPTLCILIVFFIGDL